MSCDGRHSTWRSTTLLATSLVLAQGIAALSSAAAEDEAAPVDRKTAAKAVARSIQESIPPAQQQSQRDLSSLLKQLRQPEQVEQATTAAEARAIQERLRYRRPYFRSGEERRSANGVLDTSLSVVYDERKIWRPKTVEINPADGRPVLVDGETIDLTEEGVIDARLRSYEGRPIGPTLRVKPGEILRVKLKNQLPPEDPSAHPNDVNIPHEFNTTNLHTHGLHVTPVGNGDNVLLSIRPGEEFFYEVPVPEDHQPGTFWYHAHRHGSTAMQVSSGMAGALIVDSPDDDPAAIDNVPGIKTADERTCVFQQISYVPPSYAFSLLPAMNDPNELPETGRSLVAVGRAAAGTPGEKLFFRIFDEDGARIRDLDEAQLPASVATPLKQLKARINALLTSTPPATAEVQRRNLLPRVWSLVGLTNYELEEYDLAFGANRWRDGKNLHGWRTTINGQFEPIIRVKSGKLQRFRFIHAGVRDPIIVQFTPLPEKALTSGDSADAPYDVEAVNEEGMREIARDGIPLKEMRQTNAIELFPGYRSDALVRFTNATGPGRRPQYYVMWNAPSTVSLDPNNLNATKEAEVLAVVEVMPGSPLDDEPWPSMHDFAKVRKPAPPDPRDVVGLQAIELQIVGPPLAVNGQPYDPDARPLAVQLGRTDEWRLSANLGNHPFHIHVNPFYVVSKTVKHNSGAETTTEIGEWKDTLLVRGTERQPDGTDARVSYKTLTNYKRYIGEFVLHCHILDHEDTGMMMGVSIKNSPFQLGARLAAPYAAPAWKLPDAAGAEKALGDVMGTKATVLVFLEGQSCSACDAQMQALKARASEFAAEGANIVFVAPNGKKPTFPESGFPLPVVFDQDLGTFAAYGAYVPLHRAALHGTFILDAGGLVRWRDVGDEPFDDLDTLLREVKAAAR